MHPLGTTSGGQPPVCISMPLWLLARRFGCLYRLHVHAAVRAAVLALGLHTHDAWLGKGGTGGARQCTPNTCSIPTCLPVC